MFFASSLCRSAISRLTELSQLLEVESSKEVIRDKEFEYESNVHALTLALSFGTVTLESVQALPVALWLVATEATLVDGAARRSFGCCFDIIGRSVKDTS